MPEEPPGDEIVLSIPAAPEFVPIARLTGAGLATRVGMAYDEVEDLRIALGEACSVLIGDGTRPGVLTLSFEVDHDSVGAEVVGSLTGDRPPGELVAEQSEEILDAVTDGYDLDLAHDRVSITKLLRPEPGAGAGGEPVAG